jgi:hypothetical protein
MGIVGTWRITEMEPWDQDAVDLVGPATIRFNGDGTGQLAFIAVTGTLDGHFTAKAGRPGFTFTWEGFDEGDPVSGRGWAVVEADGRLFGRIYVHQGDDAAFTAVREPMVSLPSRGGARS